MKKIISIIMLAVMTATLLCGCGADKGSAGNGSQSGTASFSGTMSELVDKIYANHKELDIMIATMPVDIADKDALVYMTGLSSADNVAEAVVSEPMIGSLPYSLVLVKAKSADAAEGLAKAMNAGIDTRKWICVEADTKVAAYAGDVAMFFMINSEYKDTATTDSILAAFEAAMGGKATVVE